ncbi:hypothetical protein AXK58_13670 [Tsukamurella tyrosinosolvens]|nr:hypothetical protein AXK58_13670 [Tsukamurella tyrosinosolvens]
MLLVAVGILVIALGASSIVSKVGVNAGSVFGGLTKSGSTAAAGAGAGAVSSGTGTYSPDPSTLAVSSASPGKKYQRAAFGESWTDKVDVEGGGNGCDTRNDILHRDLTNKTYVKTSKCPYAIATGTLADPYTGRAISFTRGAETSSTVQVDHLVALENAWDSGAWAWDVAQRTRIANDPANLLASDGSANMSKGSKTADRWLPPNPGFQCRYVKLQIMVKNKYRLTVTASEKATMQRFAGRC